MIGWLISVSKESTFKLNMLQPRTHSICSYKLRLCCLECLNYCFYFMFNIWRLDPLAQRVWPDSEPYHDSSHHDPASGMPISRGPETRSDYVAPTAFPRRPLDGCWATLSLYLLTRADVFHIWGHALGRLHQTEYGSILTQCQH